MFLRTLLLVLAATVLVMASPAARACPMHEGAAAVESSAGKLPSSAIAPNDCTASDSDAPCGSFHLCCVTPAGLPPSVSEVLTVTLSRLQAEGHLPVNLGISSDVAAPPPRS